MNRIEIRVVENLRDSKLIVDHLNGDVTAFGKLTDFHKVELYWFNYSILHNREDAEDAMQEEFIILLDCIDTGKYVERQVFGGWLKRAARYYLSHLQRKGKLITIVINELPDEIVDLFDSIDLSEGRLEILWKAMNCLPERDLMLLNLRYWQGLSWREIGGIMGIDENSASGQHGKVLGKLRREFENLAI